LIWDASTAPLEFTKENISKRRNTMSEESKKIEKIEKEAKQDVKEVKPTELSEQELDNVAGGRALGQLRNSRPTSTAL